MLDAENGERTTEVVNKQTSTTKAVDMLSAASCTDDTDLKVLQHQRRPYWKDDVINDQSIEMHSEEFLCIIINLLRRKEQIFLRHGVL